MLCMIPWGSQLSINLVMLGLSMPNFISVNLASRVERTCTWLMSDDSTRPEVVKEVNSLALILICFSIRDKICWPFLPTVEMASIRTVKMICSNSVAY